MNRQLLDKLVEGLKTELGGDLLSVVLYGSAVTGDYQEKVSDLNVLCVLKEAGVAQLEKAYPGMKDALVEDDKLKPDVAVMLDGKITQLGLLQPVSEENEVIFIPAISGG